MNYPILLISFFILSFNLSGQKDSDNDGMPDSYENIWGLDINDPTDAFSDPDNDQILNLQEYILDTEPLISDEVEIYEYDPSTPISTVYAWLRQANSRRVIIRMPQGTYDFSYGSLWINEHRIMLQGGWNDDFSEYDPCRYKTLLTTEENFVFGLGGETSYAGIVLDGLEINCPNGWTAVLLVSDRHDMDVHVHNCSFYNTQDYGLNITARYDEQHAEVTLSNVLFFGHAEAGVAFAGDYLSTLDIRVLNCTFDNPNASWADISFARFGSRNQITLKIENSIFSPVGDNGSLFQAFEFQDIYNVTVDNSYFFKPLQPFAINTSNPITTAPSYKDAASGDYELVPTSPLVDAATDLGLPFVGAAKDVGARESGACDCRLDINCVFTNETAENAADGTATVNVEEGIGPYNIQWSNGSSGELISDLFPGKYSVIVTDATGCTAICCQEIIEYDERDTLEDTDDDTMPDVWEEENGLDITDKEDAFCDNDKDQILNLFEYQLGTDPNDVNDPPRYQVRPTMTEDEIKAIMNLATDQVVYIRMTEGDYSLSFVDSDATEGYRIIMQGGWNADFTEYSPYEYPTYVSPSLTISNQVFSVFADKDSQIDTTAMIFDGLVLSEASSDRGSIEVISYDGFVYNSFYNCSFLRNNTAFVHTAADSTDYDLWFINSVIHDNNPDDRGVIRLRNEEESICRLNVYNTTLINNNDQGIYIDQPSPNVNFRVDLKNTILWGSSLATTPSALFFDEPEGEVFMTNDNLVHNGFRLGINALFLFENGTVYDGYEDPGVSLNETFPTLRADSRYKRQGIDIGLPFSADIPDLGFNKGLPVDTADISFVFTDAICGSWSGTIDISYEGTENVEFSIDGESYSDQQYYQGLNDGTYSIYVRQNACPIYLGDAEIGDDYSDCGKDTDEDGMSDDYELTNGFDPNDATDALGDADCDAILNLFEHMLRTDPHDPEEPVRIPFRNTQSIEEFERHIVRSQDEVILLQFHEGQYDLEFYTEEYWNGPDIPGWSDETSKRMVIQGGWNEDYTEYNPFCYRTIVKYEDDFVNLKVNHADSIVVIFDGLEMEAKEAERGSHAFFAWNFGESVQYGFNNCSITKGYTGIEFRVDVNAGPLDFYFINSTIGDNHVNFDLTLPNGEPHLNFNLINSVITHQVDDEKGLFELQKIGTDSTNVRITNCIFWDEIHEFSTNIFPDKNIYMEVTNSVFKGGNGNEYASFVSTGSQDIDPMIQLEGGHYVLPKNSSLLGGGVDTGIPHDPSYQRPHIGVNKNVLRINDVEMHDTYCNDDDGWLRVDLCSYAPVEFSLDSIEWKSFPYFPNLTAGQYDFYARTVSCDDVISMPFRIKNENSDLEVSCQRMDTAILVQAIGGIHPLTYLWDDPTENTTPELITEEPGIYTVTVTDENGCAVSCSYMLELQNIDSSLEDSDNDGIPDAWEIANGLNKLDPTDALGDIDCDAVLNLFEYQMDTDPNNEKSPVVLFFREGDSAARFQDLILTGYGDKVLVRMQGGDYNLDAQYLSSGGSGVPADLDENEKRIMIQGGWNDDFSEYNPFCYPTKIQYDNFHFMFAPQVSDHTATIYDGLDISFSGVGTNNDAFIEIVGSGTAQISFYNCSVHDNPNTALDYRFDTNAGPIEFFLINSTLVRNKINLEFTASTITTPVRFFILNSVISEQFGTTAGNKGLIHLTQNGTDTIDLILKNSIIWDETNEFSYVADGNNNVRLVQCNSDFNEFTPGLISQTIDFPFLLSPNFVDPTAAHLVLPENSIMREGGIDIGLPYNLDNGAPDLGVNQNLIKLDSIITTSSDCNDEHGSISVYTCYYGDLEYSINGLPFQSSSTFGNLSAGNYDVSFQTKCGTESYTRQVTVESIEGSVGFNDTEAACGEENGRIEMNVPDTWAGNLYSIDGINFQPTPIFENLGANIYIIEVLFPDDAKCEIAHTLNQDSAFDLDTLFSSNTSCGLVNGAIAFEISGASGLSDVQVFDSLGTLYIDSEERQFWTYAGLEPNDYLIVARDDSDCVDSVRVGIKESAGIAFTDTLITHPTCGLDNGQILLHVNDPGSISELTRNGQPTSLTLNQGLPSGDYAFLVEDDRGCSDNIDITLRSSEPVEIADYKVVSTSCGEDNGEIIIEETKGNPISYSLGGINYLPDTSFVNLPSGQYNLIATNVSCADTISSIEIVESSAPRLSLESSEATTCNEDNGTALLDASQGTSPYTYQINEKTQDLPDFDFLEAGTYYAYVIDNEECVDSVELMIEESEGVSFTVVETDAICGALGSITFTAAGGAGNYSYAVGGSDFQIGSLVENLEGNYEYLLEVQDSDGCTSTAYQVIELVEKPEIEIVSIDTAYCNEPVGRILLSAEQTNGNIQFYEEGSEVITRGSFGQLSASTHTFVAADPSGCTDTLVVDIPGSPPIGLESQDSKLVFCGNDISDISFEVEGGTGIVTTTLYDNNDVPVDYSEGIPEGRYLLRAEDAFGCMATEYILIQKEDCTLYIPTTFDPNSDGKDGAFALGAPEASNFFIESFRIYDRWGNMVYDKEQIDPLTFTDWWDGRFQGEEVELGVYVYIIDLAGTTAERVHGTVTIIR